ncbi:MAG: DeoR family transcriptional regulator [Cytophagales bacterium]|nr:DeoR family transcriptional regulator [Cytophagales bacterium]
MLKSNRHRLILNELLSHDSIRVNKLRKILNVSVDTIIRDLKELEANGQLIKVHGGAIRQSYIPSFKKRKIQQIKIKHNIGKKARNLLEDDQLLPFSFRGINII